MYTWLQSCQKQKESGWANRGCPIIIWTGLNIKTGIVQKVYEWPNWSFAKMILQSGIILAKEQLDHSYTFWTMPILIFSPVQIIMGHPLVVDCLFLFLSSFLLLLDNCPSCPSASGAPKLDKQNFGILFVKYKLQLFG